jgi:phosphoribosylamine--glycine ligase
MRILIISKENDGSTIAQQLQREGHDVSLYIKDPEHKKSMVGIVPRVPSFRPFVSRSDLIICDSVGFSSNADLFRKLGKPMLCCNEIGDILELDRQRGMLVAKKVGMTIPETTECRSVKEAQALEWKNEHGYVIKPAGNLHTGSTYVCPDKELYDWALLQFKPEQEFIIQAIIDPSSTVEVSTEGWFNGVDFVQPFNHTFEEKKFLVGGLGSMTGCMGNVVVPLREPDRLVRDTVMRLAPVLKKAGYRGPMDVNCLVTKEKAYVLEFTCRFGYDAIDALIHGLRQPLSELLFGIATGISSSIELQGFDYLMAVRVSHYPYPTNEKVKGYEDGPVLGIESLGKDCFPSSMYKQDGKYLSSGADGTLCKVVSHGRDVREAQRRCYEKVRKLKCMDIQYRTDIGSRVERDMKRLEDWGWIDSQQTVSQIDSRILRKTA